jgi:hypothetical protein
MGQTMTVAMSDVVDWFDKLFDFNPTPSTHNSQPFLRKQQANLGQPLNSQQGGKRRSTRRTKKRRGTKRQVR